MAFLTLYCTRTQTDPKQAYIQVCVVGAGILVHVIPLYNIKHLEMATKSGNFAENCTIHGEHAAKLS